MKKSSGAPGPTTPKALRTCCRLRVACCASASGGLAHRQFAGDALPAIQKPVALEEQRGTYRRLIETGNAEDAWNSRLRAWAISRRQVKLSQAPIGPRVSKAAHWRFLAVLADRAALFLCHGYRCPKLGQSASSLRNKTTDGRVCLPSSALPEFVRPSGLFVSGSLLSVLWPLLTPVPA